MNPRTLIGAFKVVDRVRFIGRNILLSRER